MGLSLSSIVPATKSPPPQISLLSFPDDVVLNILSRISRIHYPSLSLVSKTFRSLLSSPDLETFRSLTGKPTEDIDCIYLCLRLPHKNYSKPRWFSLRPNPNHRLIPIPTFPDKHPDSSSVITIGSEIYVIGGLISNYVRSRKVFLLDCRSLQWRLLSEMRVARGVSAVGLLDGKIYVVGGFESDDDGENWGEVYDPKIKTWAPLLTMIPEVSVRKSVVVPDVFDNLGGWVFVDVSSFCLLVKEKLVCKTSRLYRCLRWCDLEEKKLVWKEIKGLGLPKTTNFISLANSGGRRLSVWWSRVLFEQVAKTEIWCTQVSVERRGVNELWGTVESSKVMFSVVGSDDIGLNHFLHFATLM